MDAAERKVLSLLAAGTVSEEEAEEMLDALRSSSPAGDGKAKITTSIVGESELNQALLRRIEEVARIDDHVLVEGEPGTGKMLITKAVHFNGPRADQPILFLDASATDATIETELFGVEADPAGGRSSPVSGLLRLAKRGTVCIEAIDRLSPNIQQKLAAYCVNGRFSRMGGATILRSDVRIVGICHHSLQDAVDQGRFRSDLYEMLAKNSILSPTLRDRLEDLSEIANHFIRSRTKDSDGPAPALSEAALDHLKAYAWPRNCAELADVVADAVSACDGDTITPEMLKMA